MSDNHSTTNQEDIAEAIDALRVNLDATPERETWGQQIVWAGLIAAAMGLLAWFSLVNNKTEQIQIHHAGINFETSATVNSWLGPAVEQGINAYLQASGRVHLVADPFQSAGISLPAILHPRNRNGASWILQGKMSEIAEVLELTLYLESRTTREVQFTKVLYGNVENLADLATRAATEVHIWFNLPPLTAQEAQYAQAEIPGSLQAKNSMAQGLEALDRGEDRQAIKHLEAALENSPDHPIILSNLASAWAHLGYNIKARQIAKQSFAQIGNLSRAKQLSVEARYRLLNHEWKRAEELYRALKEFYQQDIGYGLALASAQMRGSRYSPALDTLEELRNSPIGGDPRIDLLESDVWYYAGDYAKGFATAERAAESARSIQELAILADALAMQLQLAPGPNVENAKAWAEEAKDIYEKLNDPIGLADLIINRGDRAFARGKYRQSEDLYHEALVLAAQTGSEATQATALSNLARTYDLMGDLKRGLLIKYEVLENYERRDLKRGIGVTLENLAISQYKIGNPTKSLELVAQAEKHFVQYGDYIGTAWVPYHRARSQLLMGNVSDAESNMRQAQANAEEHPEGSLALHSQYEICLILLATGRFDEALVQAQQLHQDYVEAELFPDAAETRLLLSRIHQRMNNWQLAQKEAQQAKIFFDTSNAKYYLASANTEILSCQLQLGNQKQIDDACDNLAESIKELQHSYMLLRGQTKLAHCKSDQTTAQNILDNVLHIGDKQQLFYPLIEASFTKAQLMDGSRGIDNTAAKELFLAAKKLSEESGWWAPDKLSSL